MKVDIFNTDKKYKIIYADPPYQFKTYSDKGKGRSAENHYETMTLEDIKKLPVKDIADKDSVLFLWITGPLLYKGLEIINDWGFIYKSIGFIWVKQLKGKIALDTEELESNDYRMNLGYWTRQNGELCLLATKGKPKRVNAGVRQVIASPMRGHSQKPDETYNRIEILLGKLPRIELFARQSWEGWDTFGNEVNKFDIK